MPIKDMIEPVTHNFAPFGLRYFDACHTGPANQKRWPGCLNQIQLATDMATPRRIKNKEGCI